MRTWEEAGENYYRLVEDDYTLYVKVDDLEASMELYEFTNLVKTVTWGPGVLQMTNAEAWCKKQALFVLDQEIKKRK